jgi:hypothetical protein
MREETEEKGHKWRIRARSITAILQMEQVDFVERLQLEAVIVELRKRIAVGNPPDAIEVDKIAGKNVNSCCSGLDSQQNRNADLLERHRGKPAPGGHIQLFQSGRGTKDLRGPPQEAPSANRVNRQVFAVHAISVQRLYIRGAQEPPGALQGDSSAHTIH